MQKVWCVGCAVWGAQSGGDSDGDGDGCDSNGDCSGDDVTEPKYLLCT